MKKLFLVLALLLTTTIFAQENKFDINASADFVTRYVVWGSVADKNTVQTQITASYGNLSAKVWNSASIETDLFVMYTKDIIGITLVPSIGVYGLSTGTYSEIALDASIVVDDFTLGNRFAVVSGIYNTFYLRYDNYKNGILKTVTASAGWGNKQFNKTMYTNEINTLSQLQVGVGVGYFPIDNILLRTSLDMFKLDTKIGGDDPILNFSVGIQYYFINPFTEL